MNAREQGRRSVRSLTATLALSGFTVVGALSIAAYTGIEAAKAAPTQTATERGAATGTDDGSSSTSPSSSSSTSGSSTSGSAGLSAGSGPNQTSSAGS